MSGIYNGLFMFSAYKNLAEDEKLWPILEAFLAGFEILEKSPKKL